MPSVRPPLVLAVGLLCGAAGAAQESPWFVDQAAAFGLDFTHFNGMSGEFYFPEMTGGGGALFDYDNDGDLDVYLVQGHMLGPGKTVADATFAPRHPEPLTDRLYRNDLAVGPDGKPVVRFVDVTESIGLVAAGYGMGVAAGDYDNDGDVDLYVTNFGPNHLLENDGDGTFTNVTAESRTDDSRWSVAASFMDYDLDGWLDLFVGNYVDFTFVVHKVCATSTGARDYCGPLAYDPEPNRLFRNLGDGTFEDVSVASGVQGEPGSTLGVVAADLNDDGWPDLYVANDMMANQLLINQGDGTFRDDALLGGAALSGEGQAQASMGVDAADFDGDGDEDLFMTHLRGEYNTLYVNDGGGNFSDQSLSSGLANASWNFTAFGTAWFDYDNDGWQDLMTVNGDIRTIESLARAGDPYPLHQPNQLFRNLDGAAFEEVTGRAGEVFELSEVSRGAAFGDVDNDGDTDALLVNNAGPARLLVNQVGSRRPALGIRMVGGHPPRDAYGGRVVVRAGGRELWRRSRPDGSFAAANDPRVLVGLGDAAVAEGIRLLWPGGRVTEWRIAPAATYLTFHGPLRP